MKNILFFVFSIIVIYGCTSQKQETPTRGSLLIAVAESHASLITQEANEFQRLYTEAKVTVTATTTRDAIVQMLNDSVKMICVDRPLNQEEQGVVKIDNIKISETKVAEDALAIIVNQQNPIENISFQSLNEIITGQMVSWQQVPESKWSNNKIQLALTGRNSGSYELLTQHFLNLSVEPTVTFVGETQKHILEYVISHPFAIGIVSALLVYDTTILNNSIRVLDVEASDSTDSKEFVKLHQANIYREEYPLHYPVYIYSTTSVASLAAGFTAFIASATGQQMILDAGLVPATMPVRLVQLKEEN